MKKIISITLLAAILLLTFCSCVAQEKGIEEKAQDMIDEWNARDDLRLYSFRAKWHESGIYFVSVDMPKHDGGDISTVLMCGDVREKCCEPMADLFDEYGKDVAFLFVMPNGNVFAMWDRESAFEWYY